MLSQTVEAELSAEQLPLDTFGPLDPETVVLAKTASRGVLGFMNDTAPSSATRSPPGGLDRSDNALLNQPLRRTPYNRNGYIHPIELAATH